MLWFLAAGRRMGTSSGPIPPVTGVFVVNGLFLFSIKGLLLSGIARVVPNFNANLKNVACAYSPNFPVTQFDTLLPTNSMPTVNFLYIKNLSGDGITVTVKAGIGGKVMQKLKAGQESFIRFTNLPPPAVIGDVGATVEYCLFPP